jgi:vesicle-fusing ATPase
LKGYWITFLSVQDSLIPSFKPYKLVCFKRIPPNNRSILVLSTTSHRQLLDELDIADCFTTVVHDPQINSLDYVLIVLKEVKLFSESDQYQRV